MNISPFFSGYLFGWIFKMFFSYLGCIFIIRALDLDIFSYSFPVLGFLLGLMNYKLSQNYLQHTVSKLSESRNIRVVFFIAMWFLVATVAFLLFAYTMSILSISSNYRLGMNWFLLFISLPFGTVIGGYLQFLVTSQTASKASIVFCCIIGFVMMFALYLLGARINEQSYSTLIGQSELPKLDPYFEAEMRPLLMAGVDDIGISNNGVPLMQVFHSEDGRLSIKFPEGKVHMDINEDNKTQAYSVEIGSYNSKDYISYMVAEGMSQTPLQITIGTVRGMISIYGDLYIKMHNDVQIKDNLLLGEADIKKIPGKLQNYWFKQNMLLNDTAYVLEGIIRVEGNSSHLIYMAVLYPITADPNTEGFFDSFQFHTTVVMKPIISVEHPKNNPVVTPRRKSSISGEVIIRKPSISGEVIIR